MALNAAVRHLPIPWYIASRQTLLIAYFAKVHIEDRSILHTAKLTHKGKPKPVFLTDSMFVNPRLRAGRQSIN